VSPRRRSAGKRSLPANLYERKGYYAWRNPETGKEYGLGRDKRRAIIEATEANVHLSSEGSAAARLVDRVTGSADRSIAAWLIEYEKKLAERELKPNTRKVYASILRVFRDRVDGAMPIARFDTLQATELIKELKEEGMQRTAQALRARMVDMFRCAVAAGWVAVNPVLVTDAVKVKVKRSRLSLEHFQAIYKATHLTWLRNAMALALVSAQRREDIASALFKDFRDDAWWVVQAKTGNRVAIPLDLRLDVFGMSLRDVAKQCRATHIISPYLIHQTRRYKNSEKGQQIWIDTISRRFSDEVEKLGVDWGDREPPTFHEIRSLAERLYKAQGLNTQDLLGHKDPASTARYHDSRGSEWVRVQLG
jgi:enterobacteria phage integrase